MTDAEMFAHCVEVHGLRKDTKLRGQRLHGWHSAEHTMSHGKHESGHLHEVNDWKRDETAR